MTSGSTTGRMGLKRWNVDGGAVLLFLLVTMMMPPQWLPLYTSAVLHVCPSNGTFFPEETLFLLLPEGGDLLTVRSHECDVSEFLNINMSQPEHDSNMTDVFSNQWTWMKYLVTPNALYFIVGVNSTHTISYTSHSECLISNNLLFDFQTNRTVIGKLCSNTVDMLDVCMITANNTVFLPNQTIFVYNTNSTDTLTVQSTKCDLSYVSNIELKPPSNDSDTIDIYGNRWTTMVFTITPNTINYYIADNATNGWSFPIDFCFNPRSFIHWIQFNASRLARRCSGNKEKTTINNYNWPWSAIVAPIFFSCYAAYKLAKKSWKTEEGGGH